MSNMCEERFQQFMLLLDSYNAHLLLDRVFSSQKKKSLHMIKFCFVDDHYHYQIYRVGKVVIEVLLNKTLSLGFIVKISFFFSLFFLYFYKTSNLRNWCPRLYRPTNWQTWKTSFCCSSAVC